MGQSMEESPVLDWDLEELWRRIAGRWRKFRKIRRPSRGRKL